MLADILGVKVGVESAFRRLVADNLANTRRQRPMLPPTPGKVETYIRASSLGKICARKEALQVRDNLIALSVIDADLSRTFMRGSADHWMHQEQVLPAVAPDAMVGWWASSSKMLSCDPHAPLMVWTRSQAISELDTEDVKYVEPQIYDHEACLSGHPDMILDWSLCGRPDIGLEIVEFKTRFGMNFVWNKIDPAHGGSPLPEHVFQVHAYMMMTGIRRARIVYLRKSDDDFEESYAEHVVHWDAAVHEKIKKYVAAMRDILIAAKDGTLPPRKMCSEFSCAKSRACPLRWRCFDKPPKGGIENVRPA